MAASDNILLDRWYKDRDAEAFKLIAQRHAGMVFATCRRMLRNYADAEEVAQECFEVLCMTRRRPDRNLASWLHRVATNRCINRIRSTKRLTNRESTYASSKPEGVEITWDDLYHLVDEVIAELPQDLREPVVRHFFEDETHEDIAQSLGVTRSAVSHRIHRAIDRMRAGLQRKGVGIAGVALSAMLAAHAKAEAVPQTLAINMAKLALAGPAPVLPGASAFVLAAKIAGVAASIAVAGFIAWQAIMPESPQHPERSDAAVTATAVEEAVTPSGGEPVKQQTSALLAAESKEDLNVTVNPDSAYVTGRVYIAETGAPVPRVRIRAEPKTGNPELEASATTDADGVYRLEITVPGEYSIIRSNSESPLPMAMDEPPTARVARGQILEGVDFPVVMGIRVSGICVDEQGNPISGADVEGRDREDIRSLDAFITREDGRFTLAGFPRTPRFTLDAELRGRLVSDLYGPLELTEEGLSNVRLVLHPAAAISGTVVDASGKPLNGIRVQTGLEEDGIQRLLGSTSMETGPDGTFKLEGLAAGKRRIFLGVPETPALKSPATGPEYVDVEPGEHVEGLRLVLEEAGIGLTIAGRVVTVEGEPIEGARVRAHGSNVFQFADSDAMGTFVIARLPDTSVTLIAEHDKYARTLLEDVAAGSDGVEIVMEDRGVLEGQVVNAATGKPVTNFGIVHLDEATRNRVGERTRLRPQVDPEGRFRIEDVAPGPVLLVVKAEGYAESELSVDDIAPGDTISNLRVALSGGATLSGVVRDESGAPVSNADIIPGGVPNAMEPRLAAATHTDADGAFTLLNQPITLMTISVHHESFALANVPVTLVGDRENTVQVTLSKGCILSGTVYSEGEAVAEADVRLFAGQAPDIQRFTTKSDGKGVYHFDRIPTGAAHVLLVTPLILDDGTRISRWLSQNVTLAGKESTVLDFEVPPVSATVEGRVSFQGTPAPSANLVLVITTPFGTEQRNSEVDSSGAFRFEAIPAGHAVVSASVRDQGLSAASEIGIAEGQSVRVELELQPQEE
ncbi:MAG: sigma-70 family RNA polymerase sigma factor [Candidatus Hydrogenedentes bacterium]|nr:sigma-70 family RNA polymerase sigma factor [Candidatus Hydrogenedentota bacterium]